MLDSLDHLALEAKDLGAARRFYAETLSLPVVRESDTEVVLAAGDVALVVRRPTDVPRGGLHTHFACRVPAGEYDDWYARLAETFDVTEHQFGTVSSLYLYDPDGNCVELGESADRDGEGIGDVFEVVLEVADLPVAESFYTALGFEPVDRGSDRRRVRLRGPVDLELWEPHLGIADARGGVHVDVGFGSADPAAALAAVEDDAGDVESLDGGYRFRDPDGHAVTVTSVDD